MYNLKEHQWKLKSKGYWSSCIVAPWYLNNLSDDFYNIELYLNEFKKRLKTFQFKSAFFFGERSV